MGNSKSQINENRHSFLKTLFPDNQKKYAVLKMNGFVLVRQWNGGNSHWEVAIHTEDSFKKVEEWKRGRAV